MSFDPKCHYCDQKPEFLVMVEDDSKYPFGSKGEYMCGDCLDEKKEIVIEAWTEAEVNDWD